MGLSLVTPPASYPVTRAEAKERARIEGEVSDSAVDGLIAASTKFIEDYLGRSLMSQTWKLTLDAFTDSILLPRGPVQSVTSIDYFDTSGNAQTVATSVYTLDNSSDPQWVVRNSTASWPATLDAVNAVSVTFVSGYAALPESIKLALLLMIEHLNEGAGELPPAIVSLLCNERAYG